MQRLGGSLLGLLGSGTCVDGHAGRGTNLPNQPLSLKLNQAATSNRSIDAQTVDQDADRDELVSWNLLV